MSSTSKLDREQQGACSIPAATLARVTLCGLGLLLALAGVSWAAVDTTKAKENELKQLREGIESVRKAIQSDAERRNSLVGELKKADETIQSARGELAQVRAKRQGAEQQLQELQAQQNLAETKLQLERAALARELRLSYMNGRAEQFKLLLNQQDPAQLGRMMTYYGYFGRARAEHIQSINEQLAHIELIKERISDQTSQLKKIEGESERSAKALAAARQKRAATLAQVETKLKTGTQRLDKMQAEAKALERLLESLRQAMEQQAAQSRGTTGGKATPSAPPAGRGTWPWPVKGEVLARFGQSRSGGSLKWEGMVIGSGEGAEVRAPAAGRVLYADWLPGLGLLMVLDHGGGIMSLYGHNEQLFKKVGEQVSRGEVLSAAGDTGVNGRAGVYLEIRNGKTPVDPLNWLGKP